MFCTYCNEKNPDHAVFCVNCGRHLQKEMHTPPFGLPSVPGSSVNDEQATVVPQNAPAEREYAALLSSPSNLASSPGKPSATPVLAGVSSPDQQFFKKEQANVSAPAFPIQPAQPSERFGSPSNQQLFFSGESVEAPPPMTPLTPPPVFTPGHYPATFTPQPGGKSPPINPPQKGFRNRLPKNWRMITLIALIILLVGGSASFLIPWLHTILPATSAQVTITPASRDVNLTYVVEAVTGTPDASQHQVQAHLLTFTTQTLSKTVNATGKGHQNATIAHGRVTVTVQTGTVPAALHHAQSNSGVEIVIDVTHPISSGSDTFDAWANNSGSGGNIPAYDLDGSYHLVVDPSINFYLQNTQAFSGGQDAHDYAFVQQSDIDGATTPLVNQLTSDAQAAVQKQLQANEQFARDPECVPKTTSNHKANDRVSSVTVTVSVTCTGTAYDPLAVQQMAATWFKSDQDSQLGDRYALAGHVITASPVVQLEGGNNKVSCAVSTHGIWVYQFSDAQKQQIAQLIAGKPLADALAVLQKQTGVKKVNVTTSGGWGTALPSSPGDIKFNMLSVPGL